MYKSGYILVRFEVSFDLENDISNDRTDTKTLKKVAHSTPFYVDFKK